MKFKKSYVLLFSIFLAFFLGVVSFAALFYSDMRLRNVLVKQSLLNAFYCADAGIERTIFELRRNQNWRDGFTDIPVNVLDEDNNSINLGYYTVEIEDGAMIGSWPSVLVRSIGEVQNPWNTNETLQRVILARIVIENPAVYFTSTLNDIRVNSGTTVDGNILAKDIYFIVNDKLDEDLRKITVNGDVNYLHSVSGQNNQYVTINGEVIQKDPITFPKLDLDYYRSLSKNGGLYNDGDFVYNGVISYSDLSITNGIIFVEGDAHISGDVKDSINLVASGKIYIEGDIECENNAQIALSAKGDIVIPSTAPDNLTIEAFIFSESGLFYAEGEKGSKGELDFSGAISVAGNESASSVIDLNVYSTRNYSHNEQLVSNLSIPYLAFIANMVDWVEVEGTDLSFPESWQVGGEEESKSKNKRGNKSR